MSDLIKTPQVLRSNDCLELSSHCHTQRIKTHAAQIGDGLTIRRALPHHDRKTIGAWCFLDHFGPLDLTKSNGLRIGPHPHIGLQTFTYPLAGEILHRDSLGSVQKIQPHEVNLMTAGKGISHSEESLPDTLLHGVQLWIALPDEARHIDPNFTHYAKIPTITFDNLRINILAGEFSETISPVKVYSPLVGLELHALTDTTTILPLNPNFEYGILPLIGAVEAAGQSIDIDTLLYSACEQSNLPIQMKKGSRVLIIGGEPFKEDILIWWNFVARTKAEMAEAVNAWNDHTEFGEVTGYQGDRLSAPVLS